MTDLSPQPQIQPKSGLWKRRQLRILSVLALFWILSDLGFYFGLPAAGIPASYNESPIPIATFYLFWAGLAGIVFWPLYSRWNADGPWPTLRNRLLAASVWTALFAGIILFVMGVMPALPLAIWPESAGPAPDLVVATPAYFLPKTMEIVFQQMLVMALVVSLKIDDLSLGAICLACAALFGGMHVLLAFSNIPPSAVIRFIVAATMFGYILPRLILTTRFGVAASFSLHWLYYAITIWQVRSFGPHMVQTIIGGN